MIQSLPLNASQWLMNELPLKAEDRRLCARLELDKAATVFNSSFTFTATNTVHLRYVKVSDLRSRIRHLTAGLCFLVAGTG